MKYPAFFDEIEPIVLRDELGGFLGAFEDGIVEIRYLDIVKMAGHSCATVAGAWLMASEGLRALWGEQIPRRGEIRVELAGRVEENNTGVVGTVLGNITGAAAENGFGGIKGRFVRRGLLAYGADIPGDVRLTRLDMGASVDVSYRPGKVVEPGKILMSAIGPGATGETRQSFPERWQAMVRTILEHADEVIEISGG